MGVFPHGRTKNKRRGDGKGHGSQRVRGRKEELTFRANALRPKESGHKVVNSKEHTWEMFYDLHEGKEGCRAAEEKGGGGKRFGEEEGEGSSSSSDGL